VLQCVAVCCSVLRCMCEHIEGHHVEELLKSQVAAQLQSVAGLHVAVCCSVLQCVEVC